MPGHDLKVNGDYARLESLLCSYCELILEGAIQTEEGIRFCTSCWGVIKSRSDKTVLKSGIEVLPTERTHPDIAVRREVDRLPVKCYNFQNGCPWTGKLKDHEETHKYECTFKMELCRLGCGANLTKDRLQHHMESECPFRRVNCPYCRSPMLDKDLENHLFSCTNAPYTCDICKTKMSRSEMDEHQLLKCNVALTCSGCNSQISTDTKQQPNVATHLRDAVPVFHHIQSLGLQSRLLHRAVTQNKEDIKHIRAELQRGGDSIGQLDRDLEDAKGTVKKLQDQSGERDQALADLRRRFANLEEKVDKQNQIISQRGPPSLASGSYYPSNQSYEDAASNDRLMQLETKIAEQERTSGMLKVHISELELQLQASLASTYNGSFLWRIPDVRRRKRDAIDGKITSIYSPPFYTGRNGYKMCIRAYLNGDGIGYNTHVSIFFVLMKGEYDPLLKWPFDYKVSLIMVDQDHKRHIVQTFKPSPSSSSFQRPKTDMNIASGCPKFAELKVLENESYVKDEVMYIKAIVDTTRIFHP